LHPYGILKAHLLERSFSAGTVLHMIKKKKKKKNKKKKKV